MSLKGLFQLLDSHPAYRVLLDGMKSGQRVHQASVLDSARPYLVGAVWHHLRIPILVIVPRPEDARRLHDQILSYIGEESPVYLFPEPEVLPFERLVADSATNNQRMLVLASLRRAQHTVSADGGESNQPPLVVASTSAALRRTLLPEALAAASHTLEVGARMRLSDMFSRWIDLGYAREEGVEVPGTFDNKGGIVDVYSPSAPLPARIEFLGDEIESIRLFDPVTQRSIRNVQSADIIPAREVVPSLSDKNRVSQFIANMDFTRCTTSTSERFQEELAALFSGEQVEELPFYSGLLNPGCLIDHLPPGGYLVLDRDGQIESEALELNERAEEIRRAREGRGEIPGNFPSPQLSCAEFQSALGDRPRLLMTGWTGGNGGFDFRPAPSYYGRSDEFAKDVRQMIGEGKRLVAVSRHARRLAEVLAEGGLEATVITDLEFLPAPGSLEILSGPLVEGWALPQADGGLTVFTDLELFGTAKERRPRLKSPVRREAFLSEIVPGEYVVHVDHGVAYFAGTTQMQSGEEQKEYLVLEYAGGDRLYVPTDHLDRVSPYLAPKDEAPSVTRLGTAEWTRVKERVKNSARDMAQELIEIYASRRTAEGHAFSPDSPWQAELEDAFPYEETLDQERTIQEVKWDMEQARPMDRLVCGDVGYGKTEVVLRAAFKTANDGMQAALLVPTTVLAQQHYATFSERLSPFPVRVEVLSRFRSRAEQKEVIEGLKLGTVDIVIGTHRLLQKDVKFKNLGLVGVDEEQRFGVAHKEQLKRMRQEVDVLTLSATPIPRTLHIGLSGIRDMSTMETPPEERLPVKTFVCEYSDDVVKEAILRELERGGQVFFLHNRVRTIHRMADHLRRLVPQAGIAIGHGRMAEEDLEDVMVEFTRGEVDVLVCTTIIESGLDIPNANTLIIDRADRFGLSQLYQLRGRVGRGGHRAYSYLLIPRRRRITQAAEKRLKAILEASELGAGFRIAMRDLGIRGAGNILGAEQSGHIHAVGFELYNQLMNEAVAELRTGSEETVAVNDQSRNEARVNLPLAAHIPDSYISHLPTRLAIYQRLTKVQGRQDVEDVRAEIRDRFGPLAQVVDNLLYLVDLKLLAGEAGVTSIAQSDDGVTFTLLEAVGSARLALEKALGPLARVGNQQIQIRIQLKGERWTQVLAQLLEGLLAFKQQYQLVVAPD